MEWNTDAQRSQKPGMDQRIDLWKMNMGKRRHPPKSRSEVHRPQLVIGGFRKAMKAHNLAVVRVAVQVLRREQ